jgi:hypothetical protein
MANGGPLQRLGVTQRTGNVYLVIATVLLAVLISPDVYLGGWCVPVYALMFVEIPGLAIAAKQARQKRHPAGSTTFGHT